MRVYEAALDDGLLEKLIALSRDWEAEDSCYGYRQNTREDIEGNRVFLATEENMILGYLFGRPLKAERTTSVMPQGMAYFEVEELYVVPAQRSKGIGGALFRFAEQTARAEGLEYMMLGTATKDYRRILHFYLEEMGMEFWSARLFKKLSPQ